MGDIEAQIIKNHDQEIEIASIFKTANKPVTLKFEDVVYKVKLTKVTKKPQEKLILNGITGKVLPGEMLAMLGPSGSGKTTLLTALGGKNLDGTLEGSITYNNKPFSNSLKRKMGFVTQDDVLYPHLTVFETLAFTSLLRLPNSVSKQEKVRFAEMVMGQLGLSRCKNSIIGNEDVRGVSGGERKRVSIGQEMLINPSLLFLDEPTSGLDSTTAQRIVSNLWELAKGGRTIVMTIHQPSSRLFYMFDKVLLLSDGNPLYFGLGSQVMEYFASVGYAPALTMNPSDFLLDLGNGVSQNNESNEDQAMVKQNLIAAYESNLAGKLKAEVQEHNDDQSDGSNGKQRSEECWATTWWQQFTVLLRRGIKERKYQSFSGVKVAQVLAVSFIAGLLWFQSSHLQDQIGLLFFSSGFWGFYPLYQAIFTFPEERRMLAKERSSGMYRLSSYFMSRVISDLPMDLALPTVFVFITYWMAGFKPHPANFLATLSTILLNVMVSSGLGLALGALVLDQKTATSLGAVIMLSFQLAGGYYVEHVPRFIAWIKYVSIGQYTYKLLLRSQYKASERYSCGVRGEVCLVGDYPRIKAVGLNGEALCVCALVAMLVGYRLIAYFALIRIGIAKN